MRPADYLLPPVTHPAPLYDPRNTALLSEEEMVQQMRRGVTDASHRRASGVTIVPLESSVAATHAQPPADEVQHGLSSPPGEDRETGIKAAHEAALPHSLRWSHTAAQAAWLSQDALLGRGRYANDWAVLMHGDGDAQDWHGGGGGGGGRRVPATLHITAETIPAGHTGQGTANPSLTQATPLPSEEAAMIGAEGVRRDEMGNDWASRNLPLTSVGPGTFVVDAEVYHRHVPHTSTSSSGTTMQPPMREMSAAEDYFYFGRPLTRQADGAELSHANHTTTHRGGVAVQITRDPAGVRLPTAPPPHPYRPLTSASSHGSRSYSGGHSSSGAGGGGQRAADWVSTSSTVGTALGSTRVTAQRRASPPHVAAVCAAGSATRSEVTGGVSLSYYDQTQSGGRTSSAVRGRSADGASVSAAPSRLATVSQQRSRGGGAGGVAASAKGNGLFKGSLTPGEAAILRAREMLRRKPHK